MNFINKINNYLIQRYPTVWNTRIVWMLLISLLVHCLFFFIGSVSQTESSAYNDYYNSEIRYFKSGWSFTGAIISMLMLVGWLVVMFKNNAFKNFYPISNIQLFGQFL